MKWEGEAPGMCLSPGRSRALELVSNKLKIVFNLKVINSLLNVCSIQR